MAKDITLIIHGWSDCSTSFKKLKQFLIDNQVGTVQTILYADYESREDNITFNDVVDGLNDQMIENGIIDADGNKLKDVNVIVHSTGGLVIRHWIWQYYHEHIDDCPVKRLLMLAPANFGSPLAHRGKSFLGSLFKGRWKIGDMLEVGRNLLNGLELASPYQWDLSHQDVLVDHSYYTATDPDHHPRRPQGLRRSARMGEQTRYRRHRGHRRHLHRHRQAGARLFQTAGRSQQQSLRMGVPEPAGRFRVRRHRRGRSWQHRGTRVAEVRGQGHGGRADPARLEDEIAAGFHQTGERPGAIHGGLLSQNRQAALSAVHPACGGRPRCADPRFQCGVFRVPAEPHVQERPGGRFPAGQAGKRIQPGGQ
ncbi:protein of unknown function [Nitrospina watsonii]|uniref:DUF676 domain-containing protein n=1 Tax=Nitrospina watsonii TaxID=1323948 RepID=A0ABM9HF43_9BACT|nr:protein of unknown function [Nitrospina watsonii]